LLSAFAAAQAKDFWQAKDYRQWTEKECKKLLENSPWAQDYTLEQTYIEPLQSSSLPGGQASTGERGREPNTKMGYQVQFRSALPIRQALVRQQMLNEKSEQAPPEKKQEFDEQAEKFLSANFADTVLVHVSYNANVQVYDRELARYWHGQTTETLKNTTFLIVANGQKIQPIRYTTSTGAGREFQLIFPRQVNGQPLVGPKDKPLKLELKHPRTGDQNEQHVLIEFKVDKMTMQGNVIY
jgi:hypothetical protein